MNIDWINKDELDVRIVKGVEYKGGEYGVVFIEFLAERREVFNIFILRIWYGYINN